MPILVAPTALHAMAHVDAEPGTALAARDAGTIYCLSSLATTRPSDVAAAVPDAPKWFQLYVFRDRAVTHALLEEAIAGGFEAIVLTVDAPVAGRRERDHRTGFAVPASVDMRPCGRPPARRRRRPRPSSSRSSTGRWSGASWRSWPSTACRSSSRGSRRPRTPPWPVSTAAAAVVVSNHGGRQLDGVAASIDVLPEVVDAVAGRLEVYVDGGVRRGTDVAVALALGARAVLVGRPVLWGLTVDGRAGVRRVLDLLRDELELAMTLLGTPTVDAITRAHVR